LRKADSTSQFWPPAVMHRITSAKIVLIITILASWCVASLPSQSGVPNV
jgi:hypothetical protein